MYVGGNCKFCIHVRKISKLKFTDFNQENCFISVSIQNSINATEILEKIYYYCAMTLDEFHS